MSKITSNLLLMRKEWYHAFCTLNIEQLDYLEAECFFSTNGQKIMYKKHQLRRLTLLKQEDPNRFIFMKRTEHDIECKIFNNIASVTGKAVIVNKIEDEKHINFIESWIKIRDGWKLQFYTYESTDI